MHLGRDRAARSVATARNARQRPDRGITLVYRCPRSEVGRAATQPRTTPGGRRDARGKRRAGGWATLPAPQLGPGGPGGAGGRRRRRASSPAPSHRRAATVVTPDPIKPRIARAVSPSARRFLHAARRPARPGPYAASTSSTTPATAPGGCSPTTAAARSGGSTATAARLQPVPRPEAVRGSVPWSAAGLQHGPAQLRLPSRLRAPRPARLPQALHHLHRDAGQPARRRQAASPAATRSCLHDVVAEWSV